MNKIFELNFKGTLRTRRESEKRDERKRSTNHKIHLKDTEKRCKKAKRNHETVNIVGYIFSVCASVYYEWMVKFSLL